MSTTHEPGGPGTGEQPLLLITGAAGRIGTYYRGHLARHSAPWRLRLQDLRAIDDPGAAEVQTSDLADMNAARRAVAGAHTVLHLAADPDPAADFYATLLDRNIKATYNIYAAAAECGARRVIFASSVNAVIGYPRGVQAHTHMVARPGNVYGATKAWGEALAASFSSQHGLSCIAVRIGGFTPPERLRERLDPSGPDADRTLSWVVTAADLSRLFDCCLAAPDDLDFAVVHGLSNNRYPAMDLDSTRRLLGYEPQDDAFALAEAFAAES